MSERKELVIGFAGLEEICWGCDKNWKSIAEVDGVKRWDVFSRTAKPVYLGIITCDYNSYQKKMNTEYYCRHCAITILEGIIDKNLRHLGSVHPSTALRQWDLHLAQSKAEKGIVS